MGCKTPPVVLPRRICRALRECPAAMVDSTIRPDRQFLEKLGGRTRARTWDPMIKSHLLYQLSYAPGLGPENLLKRASFSKAIPVCPANRDEFSRPLAGPRNGKKPLDFSGFCRCSDRTRLRRRQSRSGPPRSGPLSRSRRSLRSSRSRSKSRSMPISRSNR